MKKFKSIRRKLVWALEQIAVLISCIIFIIFEPLIATFYLLVILIRYCARLLAKILRPDLAKIVCGRSMIFGSDDLYNSPQSTLLLSGYIDGPINYDAVCEGICTSLLDPKNAAGGLQNPEGRMYLTSWMGFRWWKPEANFSVHDHVKLYEDFSEFFPTEKPKDGGFSITNGFLEINENNFMKVANRLHLRKKPFPKEKAPWNGSYFLEYVLELILIGISSILALLFNLKEPEDGLMDRKPRYKGIIILRLHHSICDGFSILKRIFALNGSSLVIKIPEANEISFAKKALYYAIFPFITPYHVFNQLIACRDVNPWHLPEEAFTGRILTGNTNDISTAYIKTIKNNLKSTFNAIILAAMSGGIRNYMLENGIKIPERIHCMTVLPMPGHPEKLRNHMTSCFTKLPLGLRDPLSRLAAIDSNIEDLKSSIFPLTFFTCTALLGCMFTRVVRLGRKNNFATAALANIPGPQGPIEIFGHDVKGMGFSGGMHGSVIGVSITCVSFNGGMRIAAHIDEKLVPTQEKIDDLMNKIEDEFHILYREGIL